MKKKKKKDKDGSNTIVFEIREYRFRTDYDTFWLRECSGYGCMVRVYHPVTSRISAVPAFSPLPPSLNVYSKICRAQTRCRWPIVFCFFEGIRWNEWTRRKRYPFQEVKIFHPPSDKFVKKPSCGVLAIWRQVVTFKPTCFNPFSSSSFIDEKRGWNIISFLSRFIGNGDRSKRVDEQTLLCRVYRDRDAELQQSYANFVIPSKSSLFHSSSHWNDWKKFLRYDRTLGKMFLYFFF